MGKDTDTNLELYEIGRLEILRRFTFSVVVLFALFFTVVRSQARDGDYSYHGCLYLCWNKVVNNQLTWDELEVIVQQHHWEIMWTGRYSLDPTITERGILINSALAQPERDHSASAEVRVYSSANGLVHTIEIYVSRIGLFLAANDTNVQTWEIFNPSSVLAVYGKPSAISAVVIYTGNGAERGIGFYWEGIGLFADYALHATDDYSETITTCLTIEDINSARLTFYKAEEFETSLRQKNGIRLPQGNKVQQLTNFASLEEMTEAIVAGDCFELTAEPF